MVINKTKTTFLKIITNMYQLHHIINPIRYCIMVTAVFLTAFTTAFSQELYVDQDETGSMMGLKNGSRWIVPPVYNELDDSPR